MAWGWVGILSHNKDFYFSKGAGEASRIRLITEGLLDHTFTLGSAVRWLNAAGFTTITGNQWTPAALRQMIVSGRLCGWREHTPLGERKRSGFGELVAPLEGVTPIISLSETEALRRLFTGKPQPAIKHWLGSLLTCRKCGEKLSIRRDNTPRPEAYRLQCIQVPGTPHCGGISISASIEKILIEEMLSDETRAAYQEHTRRLAAKARPKALTSEEGERRRHSLVNAFASGAITPEAFQEGLEVLNTNTESPAVEDHFIYALDRHQYRHRVETFQLMSPELKKTAFRQIFAEVRVLPYVGERGNLRKRLVFTRNF